MQNTAEPVSRRRTRDLTSPRPPSGDRAGGSSYPVDHAAGPVPAVGDLPENVYGGTTL